MTFVYKSMRALDRSPVLHFVLAAAALLSTCAVPAQQSVPPTVTAQIERAPILFRPATGQVTSNFDGKTNKGLDFAGKLGDPVVAVASGRVAFAASTMHGYGQMVIIKHNDTYLTAYAHNSELLVKEGDAVNAGQTIARMGSTDTDHVNLHFEVWRNGVSIDPLQYLNRVPFPIPLVSTIPSTPAGAPPNRLEPTEIARPSGNPTTSAAALPTGKPYRPAPTPTLDAARPVRASTFNNSAPPIPEFNDTKSNLAYLRWLGEISERLKKTIPDWQTRKELLQTVWYEAKRAELDVNLVLGLIEVESNFRKFALSSTGARGFMQVMPKRTSTLGDGDLSKLFHMQTNLRYGCVILRHYLDAQYGNERRALEQYESENMGFGPVDPKVLFRVMQIQIAKQSFASSGESSSAIALEKRPLTAREKVSPASPSPSKPAVVTIPVAPDGHYYLNGTINGIPVKFLVDTGATGVSISEELALRANVQGGRMDQTETANGMANVRVVDGVNVTTGPLSVPGGVPVVIHRGIGGSALLGQRFLQHFVLTMGGGRMVIQQVPQ